MVGSANRMRKASCCDININTLQQLLVTGICWTKRGQWNIFKGPPRPPNAIIASAILVGKPAGARSPFLNSSEVQRKMWIEVKSQ